MPRRIPKSWRPVAGILAAGTALFLILSAGNLLVLPGWLEPVGVVLYRIAYLAILPLHFAVGVISPPTDFHWAMANWVVSAYGTAALGWAAWRAYRHARPAPTTTWRTRIRRLVARTSRSRDVDGAAEGALTRRQLIVGTACATACVAGAGVAAYSVAIAPGRLRVRRYRVALPDLAGELSGLRVAHISDTHYGPFVSLSFLESAIERTNDLAPDLVLLTGDYTHRTPRSIAPGIRLFAGLRPRVGTVAVLGNHDHWEGADACRAVFREIGIPLIDNSRLFLTPGGLASRTPDAAAPALCVAGLADLWEDVISFADALGDVPDRMPRLLLSHNPDAAERVPAGERVDLMVSGHTHGGQIRLPGIGAPLVPSRYGEKYAGGMCRGPRCDVLVSRGVGLSILPLRLGVPPEINLLTLESAV